MMMRVKQKSMREKREREKYSEIVLNIHDTHE